MESSVGRLADIALKSWGIEDVPLRKKSAAKLNLSLKGSDLSMKELLAQRGSYLNLTTMENNFIMCITVVYVYLDMSCYHL